MWLILTNEPDNKVVQDFSGYVKSVTETEIIDLSIPLHQVEDLFTRPVEAILYWPIVMDKNSLTCFNLVFKTFVKVSRGASLRLNNPHKLVLFTSPLPIQPVPGYEYAAATLAACEGLMESLSMEVEHLGTQIPLTIDIGMTPPEPEGQSDLFKVVINAIMNANTSQSGVYRVVADESKSKEIILQKLRSWLEELEDWKFMTTEP